METISLSRLYQQISRVVSLNFSDPIWITAEILQLKLVKEHYYIELAEKGIDQELIAQASAVIWKSKAFSIKEKINIDIQQILKPGNETRLKIQVDFHSKYGLKLIILDIDKAFHDGKISQKRIQIMQTLMNEGLWQKNRQTKIPLVFCRIAIISSQTAEGYNDFVAHLKNNEFGYKFELSLFQSSMQGAKTEEEVSASIDKINRIKLAFDCIVLIRGGGSKSDLFDFDTYQISKSICRSKLPVFSGIGHQNDESLADLNSCISFKTPTAVAEYIISHTSSFESSFLNVFENIRSEIHEKIFTHSLQLSQLNQKISSYLFKRTSNEFLNINKLNEKISFGIHQIILSSFQNLLWIESKIQQNDPDLVLKNGFTFIVQNNIRIRRVKDLDKSDNVEIVWADGKLNVLVKP
ncbi:MAG: exodeoxyribonuclease VII large subunit [Saprospiraceae bacterium]|nr:exodeoxyribonuclease VII large subunit [Saprospiraceae bacterium]